MDPIQPIQPIKPNKSLLKKSLPMLAVLVLLVGVFVSVTLSQQSQENRSRASTYISGSYSHSLIEDGYVVGGSVNGDLVGNNNKVGGNVYGCLQGNNNVIGGRVSGGVSGYGNVIGGGHGSGSCQGDYGYAPTVVPTAIPCGSTYYNNQSSYDNYYGSYGYHSTPCPTPTPKPSQCWTLYYQNRSYGNYYGSYSDYSSKYSSYGYQLVPCTTPTPTPVPYNAPTATPVPYYAPTATPVPYYAPTATPVPYNAPTPTSVPQGYGNTQAKLTIYLHGIGNAGDNANPTAQGNMNPKHPQRTVDVQIFNSANALVSDTQTTMNFVSSDGDFTGQVGLGSLESGLYNIKIKSDQYLRGLVSGIQTLSVGQTNTVTPVKLVAGDVNGDNQINILDYNLLIGCYSDLEPAVSCTDANKLLTDLDDDGNVNQYDYNLFIRELSNLNGQ